MQIWTAVPSGSLFSFSQLQQTFEVNVGLPYLSILKETYNDGPRKNSTNKRGLKKVRSGEGTGHMTHRGRQSLLGI